MPAVPEPAPQQDAPIAPEESVQPDVAPQQENAPAETHTEPDPSEYETYGNGVGNYGEQAWQGTNGDHHGDLEQEHSGIMVKEDG